jgi:hypothetical protein
MKVQLFSTGWKGAIAPVALTQSGLCSLQWRLWCAGEQYSRAWQTQRGKRRPASNSDRLHGAGLTPSRPF